MQQLPDTTIIDLLPKPQSPCFGSGPTTKRPHWKASDLASALVGRSHRSAEGLDRIRQVIDLTREVLHVPDDYLIAIVPGSATGAIETALWNLLGLKGVDVFAWDVFGKLWVNDVVEQLQIPNTRLFEADFGSIVDLSVYTGERDVVFTWNGTTSGVCIPHLDWIPDQRDGLTICDGTSSTFCIPVRHWNKIDVLAFSWQKGLGGEAGQGTLILSPRAIQRLKEHQPTWPIPRLMRLKHNVDLFTGLFEGKTINTPSMLCIEDALQCLKWAQSIGGQEGLWNRCFANFTLVREWISTHKYLRFMAMDQAILSPSSVCFLLKNEWEARHDVYTAVASLLSQEGIAYDIKNHMLAPPSFRIWCGPTVESEDIKRLLPWIDWALEKNIIRAEEKIAEKLNKTDVSEHIL